MAAKDVQVLMLEEDNDDRFITDETLANLGFSIPIQYFNNGNALLQYLKTANSPLLIVMDYNVIADNGLEILKRIKTDTALKQHPVVILSDSILPEYVQECYANGAATFIQKPSTVEATTNKIGTFFKYWLEVAAF